MCLLRRPPRLPHRRRRFATLSQLNSQMAHSTVGIISDTHGSIAAWTKALSAFRAAGVEHILHAGDVIGEKKGETVSSLLAELREVAPVTAVRGNTDDRYDGGHGCPMTATYEDSVSGVRCFVHHGDLIAHKDDEVVLSELRPPGGWRPKGDIIVYGHTHVPRLERHPSGVLFLNPGSTSGKHMPGKLCPKQAALLDCLPGGAVAVRVVALGGGEASISEWEPVDMAVAGGRGRGGGDRRGRGRGRGRGSRSGSGGGSDDDGRGGGGGGGTGRSKRRRGAAAPVGVELVLMNSAVAPLPARTPEH